MPYQSTLWSPAPRALVWIRKKERKPEWEREKDRVFPPREREESDELHDNELCYTAIQHTALSLRLRADLAELNGLQQMFGDYNHTELRSSLDLQIFA